MAPRSKPNKPRSTETASWLTRRQVALLLGMTEPQVEARHGKEFHPRRAADRSWRYPPTEVAALAAGGGADGVVSAKVFGLFKANVDLPDVVIQTQQTPARVNLLRADYDQMVGNLVLTAPTLDQLRGLLGAEAATSEQALVTALRSQLEARYQTGFREGREDAEDFGEVVDCKTGERRRVTRDGADRSRG